MNMRPFIVEFFGTPESGKTTCIKSLITVLEEQGLKVGYIQESAEVVPDVFPKGSFDANMWMKLKTVANILEAINSDKDIYLVDRGIFDGITFTIQLLNSGKCSFEQFLTLSTFLNSLKSLFPDLLIIFHCTPETSIARRGGEGRIVTHDFVERYNNLLFSLKDTFEVSPHYVDTSNLSETEILDVVVNLINDAY